MAKSDNSIEINLFSPLGMTILFLIAAPIFGFTIFTMYFPERWDAMVVKFGLVRSESLTKVSVDSAHSSDIDKAPNSVSIEDEEPTCKKAIGRIWTNVRLYRDNSCTQPFATIVGGGKLSDGRKGVLIKFDEGTFEWKTRRAVTTQAFVRSDDPAHDDMLWRVMNQDSSIW